MGPTRSPNRPERLLQVGVDATVTFGGRRLRRAGK
jgi:hypothetical protein